MKFTFTSNAEGKEKAMFICTATGKPNGETVHVHNVIWAYSELEAAQSFKNFLNIFPAATEWEVEILYL